MKWLIPATAALALAATPALAAGQNDNDIINNAVKQSKSQTAPTQNSDRRDRNTEAQNERAENDNERAQNDDGGQWSGHRHRNRQAMSLQKMRDALKNAGFTNIRVLDAKYLVQAKDHDGNTVFMAVNPPSLNKPGAETSGAASNIKSNGGTTDGAQASNGRRESRNDDWNGRRDHNLHDNYNSGYDQGYREGFNRGYQNGSRY